MEIYILIGAAVIAIGAIGFAVYEHIRTKRLHIGHDRFSHRRKF